MKNAIRLASVVIALSLSSCNSVHTMLTGEVYSSAPDGLERTEAELVVSVDDSFFRDLSDVAQIAELGYEETRRRLEQSGELLLA